MIDASQGHWLSCLRPPGLNTSRRTQSQHSNWEASLAPADIQPPVFQSLFLCPTPEAGESALKHVSGWRHKHGQEWRPQLGMM